MNAPIRLCLGFVGLAALAPALLAQGQSASAPEVARWVRALRSPDPRVRLEAAYAVPSPGRDAKAHVAALVEALRDRDATVRQYAAGALGELAREPGRAVPALVKALDDPSALVRSHATLALIKIGGPAVPELVRALRRGAADESGSGFGAVVLAGRQPVTTPALDALVEIGGPAAPALVGLLAAAYEKDLPRLAAAGLKRIGKPAVADLGGALGHRSRKVRRLALGVLADLGPEGAGAVPELAALFRGEDGELAEEAGRALARMGPKGLRVLREGLGDRDDGLRLRSLDSLLAGAAPDQAESRRAVGVLSELLRHPDVRVRRRAARALAQFLPPLADPSRTAVGALAKALADGDGAVRYEAVRALRLGPKAGAAVPALRKALADRNPNIRHEAVQALAGTGEAGRPALAELIDLLQDSKDYSLRAAAADAVGKVGGPGAEPVAALARALEKDPAYPVRTVAAAALGRLAKNPDAVSALAGGLKNNLVGVPVSAARALGAAGPVALPAVRKALQDSSAQVRVLACSALQAMDPKALARAADRSLLRLLQEALADDSLAVRRAAAEALGRLGEAAGPAAPALARLVPDPDWWLRSTALNALGRIGPAARKVVPDLEEAAARGNRYERVAAAGVLVRIDARAAQAVLRTWLQKEQGMGAEAVSLLAQVGEKGLPALRDALASPDSSVRGAAAAAVGRLGARAKQAAPDLGKLLKDRTPTVRAAAAESLGRIGTGAGDAVPALAGALADADPGVRRAAARALGAIGTGAKTAGPALARALADERLDVRVEAARALTRLDFDLAGSRKLLTAAANDWFVTRRAGGAGGGWRTSPLSAEVDLDMAAGNDAVPAAPELDMEASDVGESAPALPSYGGSPRRYDSPQAGHRYGARGRGARPPVPRSYGSPPRASPRPHLIERRADLPAEPRAAAGRGAPAGAFAAGGAMPEFPWPPRQFFAKTRLDRDRLGNNRTRLRVVYRYLVQELNRAQFKETRLFQVGAYPENGFVVLTRLERADPAGVPLPGNRRWSRLGTPSSGDLLDQLGSLYLEPPGHYRMFAFVVARDQEVPEGGGPALHPAEAEVLVQSGWKDVPELPEPIAGFRFEGYYCHVLVYQFERTATDGTRVLRAARPAAAARQQLAAAGLKLTTEE